MVSLNLFDILQNILSESVSSKAVNDAIDNQYQVEIEYDEEGSDAKGKRIINKRALGRNFTPITLIKINLKEA